MSTMTTLSHPPSTSLTIPATQNTAPVFSFSCLYTHDLRRKQKRWQDGLLRFHTFNKRIMVYDVPRNFIGDTFWRESQALQDGDDLELEKGILVQVGEQVDKTVTDLSGLLEKRTPKRPVAEGPRESQVRERSCQIVARNQAGSAIRAAAERQFETPFTQLRPKSLNALLGRPRGPVGRAAVPTRSPAELRNDQENGFVSGERPPKRRRVEYHTGSPSVAQPARIGIASSMPKPVGKPGVPPSVNTESRVTEGTRSANSGQEVAEPEHARRRPNDQRRQNKESPNSDQNTINVHLQDLRSSRISPLGLLHPQLETSRTGRQTDAEGARLKQGENLKLRKGQEESSEQRPKDRVPPKKVSVREMESKETSLDDEPRPEHMLRIASKKPRKKLMYRDLLPQSAPRSYDPPPLKPQKRNASVNQPKTSNRTSRTRPEDPLEEFHQGQQDRLHSRFQKRTSSTKDQPLPPSANANIHQDETSKPSALLHNPSLDIPDSLFLTLPSPPPPLPPPLPDPIPTSTQAVRILTEIDARLLQRPSIIKAALPTGKQQRPHHPLQRSTSDLPKHHHHHPTTITKKPLRKTLSDTLPSKIPPTTKTSTLYRSSSSSSSSISTTNNQNRIAQAQPAANPWSSREAWDLFGYVEGGNKRITTSNGLPG
ncbi:MAG: hypothetical protein L6R35_005456, partial [Caloplaca aegaea]